MVAEDSVSCADTGASRWLNEGRMISWSVTPGRFGQVDEATGPKAPENRVSVRESHLSVACAGRVLKASTSEDRLGRDSSRNDVLSRPYVPAKMSTEGREMRLMSGSFPLSLIESSESSGYPSEMNEGRSWSVSEIKVNPGRGSSPEAYATFRKTECGRLLLSGSSRSQKRKLSGTGRIPSSAASQSLKGG